MIYRISTGLFLFFLGLGYLGVAHFPDHYLGILAAVGGLALLAGV